MLYHDQIDVVERINAIKANESKKYIFNYHDCLKTNFRFQPKVYNGCDFLMQNAKSFNDVAILLRNEHFWYMSKDKAINVMGNIDLKGKSQYL